MSRLFPCALALVARVALAQPAVVGLTDGGVGLEVAGVALRAWGVGQVEARLADQSSLDELNPSTGQPLNQLGVALRQLRLGVSATKFIFSLSGELEANTLNGLGVRLFSADVGARWPLEGLPLVQLRAGLLRIKFGADVQAEAMQRPFFEPTTMTQALFPGTFDLGVELTGAWRVVRYQLAVMNGEPVGERALPAKDPNAAKDFMGRVGASGRPVEPLLLEAHVSGLWGTGFHVGAPAGKDTLVWADVNEDGLVQSTELQIIGGLPATASSNFNRFALGADVHAGLEVPVLGHLDVAVELIWAKNLDRGLFVADPVSTGRDARELGFAVAVTQQLPMGFLVGARVDLYDPDADASEQRGVRRVPVDQRLTTWGFVASWHWDRFVRVMAQYDRQSNALGRSSDGRPTTLGRDRFTLRLEARF